MRSDSKKLCRIEIAFLQGMIFSSLVGGIFAELGLHVTNFDSVVSRFNDELSMKSFVLIDEGM